MFAYLIEVHAGAFPAWFAPVQVAVAPVGSEASAGGGFHAFACRRLVVCGTPGGGGGGRIARVAHRGAVQRKIPYVAVIGAQEAADGSVSLRLREAGALSGVLPIGSAIAALSDVCGAPINRRPVPVRQSRCAVLPDHRDARPRGRLLVHAVLLGTCHCSLVACGVIAGPRSHPGAGHRRRARHQVPRRRRRCVRLRPDRRAGRREQGHAADATGSASSTASPASTPPRSATPSSCILRRPAQLDRPPATGGCAGPGPANGSTTPSTSPLPATRDVLCGNGYDRYTSCRNGNTVVVNVARWARGIPGYGADLTAYRQYVVNHETGHRLGRGHELCPGPGPPGACDAAADPRPARLRRQPVADRRRPALCRALRPVQRSDSRGFAINARARPRLSRR